MSAAAESRTSKRDEPRNPFPGPQPYRAADRSRFYGRGDLSTRLEGSVLANRCVTVYGPSGAGKSSLMQAAVIPALIEAQELRVARVDGWPEDKEPTGWLADAVYADLEMGERAAELSADEALFAAARRAARKSPRIVLIYLDQVEQLLYPGRAAAEVEAFFASLNALADMPLRSLRLVLSLREDYLGRFRDRLREHGRLLSHNVRVGPLTVAELADAVCKAAAAGKPPQAWDIDEMRSLMLQVRVPGQAMSDEAEAQAAYAQIVCRALFQRRAQGGEEAEAEAEPIEAELILRGYFETTLDDLGPLGAAARRLLEDHLVTADGSRTLRTEKELLRILPAAELGPILKALEVAAILHAEEHQGSRYFEIGHDWLARRVFEARQGRELEEEKRRRDEEVARELAAERAEAQARLDKARAQRRFFAGVAVVSTAVAAGAVALGLYAFNQRAMAQAKEREARIAEESAKASEKRAEEKAIEASDARLLAGFRELKNSGQLAWGTKLLPDVQRPEAARGWIAMASEALGASALSVTLRGHEKPITQAVWSHDGERALSASEDGTARVWDAGGAGDPIRLSGHEGPVTAAVFSPDDKTVLTASEDGTARLWRANGGELVVIDEKAGPLTSVAFSPDGSRITIGGADAVLRVYRAGGGEKIELKGHAKEIRTAAFSPDGARVLTTSEDGTARLWQADGGGRPVVFKGPAGAELLHAALSPDGARVLTAWSDGIARIFSASGEGRPVELARHGDRVLHAAWSPDGSRVATASEDKTARVWSADGRGPAVVLSGHTLAVTYVGFRPDGRYVGTASLDQTLRVWPVQGGKHLELNAHDAPVISAAWSPDGSRILTAAGVARGRTSRDATVRIWTPPLLDALPRDRPEVFHSAFIGAGAAVFVSACDDHTVRSYRAGGGDGALVLPRQEPWVATAAISPDGSRVAAALFDGTTRVVGADGAGDVATITGHSAPVRAVAFSPDGSRMVTASDDRTARIVSADGRGEAKVLSGHSDALTSAAWSPDGHSIVTASMDHTARIFASSGAGEPVVLRGHGGAVLSAAWSADSAYVITGSEDGTAQIWSAKSGQPALSFDRGGAVIAAIFDGKGERVAVSSRRGGVLVSRADGQGDAVLLDTPSPVMAMAFVDGDTSLFTVSADNTTRPFLIDVAGLRRGLAATNGDCLPIALRIIYLGELAETAREGYAACEREHSRTPFFVEGEGL